MDLFTIFTTVNIVAAGATAIAVQILKSKFIPGAFQDYPVPTMLLVSLVAALIGLDQAHVALAVDNWKTIAASVIEVAVVSAMTYENILSNWPAVKRTEAAKSTTVGKIG